MKFEKFIPLEKMEEASDGTLRVFGLVTEQKPDLEREVCDYATTQPLYLKRTQERLELTSKIAGMEPSIMVHRGQHDVKQAIGAGRSIVCDDASKSIRMGFHIVDAEAVKKWKAGIFIGFSQGGEYVAKWNDPDFPGCTRYTADPLEVSSVDAPCLPSALAESMKGRTVTLTKAAGGTVQIPLDIPSVDGLRLAKAERDLAELRRMLKREFSEDERKKLADEGKALPDGSFPIENEEDLKNAIHAYGRAKDKEAAKKHIISRAKALGLMNLIPEDWTSETEKAAIRRACAKISLSKGMYEVGWFAELLESLNWLCLQTEFERDLEDDGSKVPEGLREAWLALLGEFKAMAIEEADELAAHGGKGAKAMKITDQAGLTKAAKTMAEHMEKHMEMHKAHHEKLEGMLAKDHPLVKSSQAMMDHCEKCMKAAKDSAEGDDGETEAEKAAKIAKAAADAAAADPIAKAITAAVAPLVAKVDELEKKLAKTPAPVEMPHTGAGNGVAKSVQVDADFAELVK